MSVAKVHLFLCFLVTELLIIHSPQSIVVMLLENEKKLTGKTITKSLSTVSTLL